MNLNPICHPSHAKKMKCLFLDYIQLLMIGRASWETQTPSTTPLHPKKWNAHFWITFNFWWLARLVNGLEPHPPLLSSQKKWNAHFWITFSSDDLPGWLMNLNLICHPFPTKKMKCSIFEYVQLLMISQAGWWTRTPSATPLQPIKWNAHFRIMFTSDVQPGGQWTQTPSITRLQPITWNAHFWILFNFWWSASLVDGLKPHLPSLSSQKNEMLIFGLHSTSDDWPSWMMDSNLIHHPSPAKKLKCSFLDCIHFWWSAGLVDELEPHLPLLSSQKNEMLIFWLCSTSDDQPGWSMDSKPICHPSPVKKMKCLFLDYIQLLMISWAGWWSRTPSSNPLQPKNEMLIFGLYSTSNDCQASWGTQTPFATPLHPKKWNATFWITFNFWWLARLVNGLEPHPPLLSCQKKWNAHFWITFPSDDLPGWLMNLNLICHPSPTKKMKCSIFDYVQLLMISQPGQWTQSPSATPLQPIKWNASFWIMFTSDDQPGWLMDSNPICHPSPANKMKCSL